MASDANKSYFWGILGCGWLGQAVCQAVTSRGSACWGTGRSPGTLDAIRRAGGTAIEWPSETAAPSSWPKEDVLLVAWPPSAGMGAFRLAADRARRAQHTVLISSTSVYPESEGEYFESDAVRRISPHSGACLLDLESLFDLRNTTLLRAGGLYGPGRHPRHFLRGKPLRQPDGAVNMVHQSDLVRAILHVVEHRLCGPFNVVSPHHVSRRAFYAAAGALGASADGEGLDPATLSGRRIQSHTLLQTGFSFEFPNPAEAVRILD